jgi:hypothetical protein
MTMRLNVQMQTTGRTLQELTDSLTSKWCNFVDDQTAPLPVDSEIYVHQPGENPDTEFYTATFTARVKL